MPLRLFGGHGGTKSRTCPACEQSLAVEATFCPSCYMVIRPEGAADLREYLRGGRIPSDVYLLRKLQTEDGNTGPVLRASPEAPAAPSSGSPPATVMPDARVPPVPEAPPVVPPESSEAQPSPGEAARDAVTVLGTPTAAPRRVHTWKGVFSFLKFEAPFPPSTDAADGIPTLLAWMLEHDPFIPNNLERLEDIHASVFPSGPAARLGYERHLLLQIADDLALHTTQETMDSHLAVLAAAYRRAAGKYHSTPNKGTKEASAALWQMSSAASRLRMEGWVYRSRFGTRPATGRPRRPRGSRD